jgi:hypothetical protein
METVMILVAFLLVGSSMYGGGVGARIEWRRLYDPPQLARLVAGRLQCEGEKLCSRDWPLLLILKIVEPRHELRSPMRLPVHNS